MTNSRRTFLRQALAVTATASCSPHAIFGQRGLQSLTSLVTRQGSLNTSGANRPFFKQAKHRPEVIAHRGGEGQWPGETMFAFKEAMSLKVDVLEMDVYLTRDGHLILMHDNDIKSVTSHNGPGSDEVHKFTLAELKRLNAAKKWAQYRDDPNPDLKVTSLEEVFGAFRGMRMNIEMKNAGRRYSPARKLADMISQANMQDNVLVASMSDNYIREFRQLRPNVATSASRSELLAFAAGNDSVADRPGGPDAFQMKDRLLVFQLLTKRFVERAQRRNLPVHAWTVNDIDGMQRMINLRVEGIITDYPGPLLALLNRL